jgi:cytochrome P450
MNLFVQLIDQIIVICPRAQRMLSQWLAHRNPAFWPNADAFVPERFAVNREARVPRHAFFPFGGGPRLASQFVLNEAELIFGVYRTTVSPPNY